MKKVLLSVAAALPCLVFGQHTGKSDVSVIKQETLIDVSKPAEVFSLRNYSAPLNHNWKSSGVPYSTIKVGSTFYDLQTNASIARRVLVHDNGKVSVSWTTSANATADFPQRGSGYNNFDGTNWNGASADRIESVRLGWPSIGVLPNNNEYIIAHDATNGGYVMSQNTGIGSSTWTSGSAFLKHPNGRPIWNRAANNGNTIHLIGNYADSSQGDPPNIIINGITNPTTYSRSLDGGQTWTTALSILPGYDAAHYVRGSGDGYALDVKGNTVAIVIADNLGGDVALWKSTDNGQTFTKTVVDTFPFLPYDKTQVVPNWTPTNDGSCEVVLDASGNAHVFWGYTEVRQPTSDSSFFRPNGNSIMYWNEGTGAKGRIAGMLDLNNDGVLTVAAGTTFALGSNNSLPSYGDGNGGTIQLQAVSRYGNTTLATMPSATIDAQGRIYCLYSAPTEGDVYLDDTTTGCNFRDVYIVYSTDNGENWSNPQNITQNYGNEDVFACVGKKVANNALSVIWQTDEIPGTNLQNNSSGGSHPIVENNIMFASIPTDVILNNQIGQGPNVGIKDVPTIYVTGDIYPNPLTTEGDVIVYLTKTTDVKLSVHNLLGQQVMSQNLGTYNEGTNQMKINVGGLANGVYTYTLDAGGYTLTKKMVVSR